MPWNSRPVRSKQQLVHPGLGALVQKHLAAPSRRPPALHSRAAFASISDAVESHGGPLVFDSFCGTGLSTAALARRYPESFVLGIDKSAHRLARHPGGEADNYRLVQAECGDFWRLATAAGWRLQRHYLLYPNPWPKPGQLKRRLHGSPDFRDLLALGGSIELRSNWQVYVEEFGVALILAGQQPLVAEYRAQQADSAFERKYAGSGHRLWRCRCKLVHNSSMQVRNGGYE